MTYRTFLAAIALGTAACTSPQGGAQDTGYAQDGDTGAAAPATQSNIRHSQPPDSTTGVSSPTGRPGAAGVPQAKDANIAEPVGQNPSDRRNP